jgi:hypothetical protein
MLTPPSLIDVAAVSVSHRLWALSPLDVSPPPPPTFPVFLPSLPPPHSTYATTHLQHFWIDDDAKFISGPLSPSSALSALPRLLFARSDPLPSIHPTLAAHSATHVGYLQPRGALALFGGDTAGTAATVSICSHHPRACRIHFSTQTLAPGLLPPPMMRWWHGRRVT